MILIRIIKIFTKSSGINCSVIFCYFLIIYIFSNHKQWDSFFSNNVSIILCLNILKVDLDSKLVYKIAFMQETNRFGVDFHIFGIDITMSRQKFYEKIRYYQKRLKKLVYSIYQWKIILNHEGETQLTDVICVATNDVT